MRAHRGKNGCGITLYLNSKNQWVDITHFLGLKFCNSNNPSHGSVYITVKLVGSYQPTKMVAILTTKHVCSTTAKRNYFYSIMGLRLGPPVCL